MRPRIICHMVSSIDGRLHPSRYSVPAAGVDGARLRRHYEEVAAKLDGEGWIVGRTTAAEIAEGQARTAADVGGDLRGTHVADRKDRDLAGALDTIGGAFGVRPLLLEGGGAIKGDTVWLRYGAEDAPGP